LTPFNQKLGRTNDWVQELELLSLFDEDVEVISNAPAPPVRVELSRFEE